MEDWQELELTRDLLKSIIHILNNGSTKDSKTVVYFELKDKVIEAESIVLKALEDSDEKPEDYREGVGCIRQKRAKRKK